MKNAGSFKLRMIADLALLVAFVLAIGLVTHFRPTPIIRNWGIWRKLVTIFGVFSIASVFWLDFGRTCNRLSKFYSDRTISQQ